LKRLVKLNILLILFSFLLLLLPACVQNKAEEDTYLSDEQSVLNGEELFNQYCAACHNFETTEIGPNLSGVTAEESKQWLASFIKNAPQVIESGDERAVQLFEEFNQYMPAFTMLGEPDIEALLAYIHTHQKKTDEKEEKVAGGLENPVPAKIPPSNLSLVLEKFLTMPVSAEEPPVTRINKLLSIKGKQGERLFIHELRGELYEIREGSPQIYLDMTKELPNFIDRPGLGTGLGSFDFHPDFENNGLLYTTHTEPENTAPADFAIADTIQVVLQWVLTEWKTPNPQATKFTGTHREMLRVDMYSGIHGFQELTFNPLAVHGEADYGMLYLGIGDGGATLGGYPFMSGDKGKIWSTVLRFDPTGTNSKNGNYGIPADNPFVEEPNALGEVWCYGFRNPHRICWDLSGSKKMFITDIGQGNIEEVNLGKSGANYGWPKREGTFVIDMEGNPEVAFPLPSDDQDVYTYPVIQYDHDEGNAISGGFVYAGTEVPTLRGKYVFGDIVQGRLFYTENREMQQGQQAQIYELGVEVHGEKTDLPTLVGNNRVDLRLGIDGKGELYIFAKADGVLWKVVGCKKAGNSSPAG
jgi:glucose/arabinose dehydrogenase/cytochrome c2